MLQVRPKQTVAEYPPSELINSRNVHAGEEQLPWKKFRDSAVTDLDTISAELSWEITIRRRRLCGESRIAYDQNSRSLRL